MNREGLVFLAKLAENAERYDDMVANVSAIVAQADGDLTDEERTLVSVAYKNIVGMRRASWRVLCSIEKAATHNRPDLVKQLREKVESELAASCNEVIEMTDKSLVPKATNAESKIFYLKMKGDYARYLAEFQSEDAQKSSTALALEAYEAASSVASTELPPTHPVRLGLALNFAVFHYDILESTEDACKLAKQAFDDAIAELDTLSDDSYRDSTLVMQLLRDNLTLWTSDDSKAQDPANDAI
ncbi:hypothetical protein Poli38472_014702 [Pythium oligandrum]|uniref:14-3-3 domain-containing protein n=1 Tax=Pythium oligandrum TaxID=41045 RepID=A0A8K1CIF8_PYTOL|nr:hypothetical protein Poli38472_014702 [Pythium oligandrum]|eukprot:TMW63997.1 hypothetical protein Poli38472_014702 [Pythium oligandrum]